MELYSCAAGGKGSGPHLTPNKNAGFFGMFGAATLCKLPVRKVYPERVELLGCWECEAEMHRIQADRERLGQFWANLKTRLGQL